jgi:glycosyltransferase involved in cell wall biosynthesis
VEVSRAEVQLIQHRIAFLNTRLPSLNSFLVRDLRFLLKAGVSFDLHLFDVVSLDPELRREIEAMGGRVARIPFPGDFRTLAHLLRHAVRHPALLAKSFGIALAAVVRSPTEGIRALAVLPASIRLGDEMRRDGVERVHGMWAGVPTSTAYWIRINAGIPYSYSAHAWDLSARTYLLSRKTEESESVLVCSRWAARRLEHSVGREQMSKAHLVHHGLDLSEWDFRSHSRGNGVPVILAIGRLTAKKGFEYLVQACALLTSRGIPFHCQIIGPDRGLNDRFMEMIEKSDLAKHVELTGELPHDEIRRRLETAALLACPSITTDDGASDGIPNVILEAIAAGTPVVTTNAGGIAEVIKDGETGWVVPQRDPSALANAISAMLADPIACSRSAQAAYRIVQREFAASTTVPLFLDAMGLSRPSEVIVDAERSVAERH